MLAYDVTFAHNWFAFSVAHWPQGGDGFFFWSISVEEQFYLLAPIIIYTSHFGRSPALWGVVSAVLIAVGQPDFASIAAGVCATALKERAIAWPGQGAIQWRRGRRRDREYPVPDFGRDLQLCRPDICHLRRPHCFRRR